jgi:glycosyltransferase involved in cell wall biosynthesis
LTTARQTPTVSLIMPVWQPHVPWLNAAVSSALADNGGAFELILVDDGCEPAVETMLEAGSSARMRVVRIEHAGQAAALNAGIAAATGDWLRFIDADDVVITGSTSHLLALAGGETVIAYGAMQVCDEQLRPGAVIGSKIQGDVLVDCLLGRFHTRHPAMLFPRRVVEAAGPWDTAFRVSADWDFVLRALEHAPVRGDGQVTALYRRHKRSVSRMANVAAGEESRRRMLVRYFERHPEQVGTPLERQAWGALYRDRGYAYWDAHEYGSSMRRLALALRTEPLSGTLDVARFAARRMRRLVRPDRWIRASGSL